MSFQDTVRSHRNEILAAARRHGATDIALFGSVARGDDDATSDVDFLVDMGPGRSLFDLGGLQMDLQDIVGRHVDVVTRAGLRERIRDVALRESSHCEK